MRKLTKILLINIFAFSILTTQALAKDGTVTANTSVVMREKPSKDGEPIVSIVKDTKVEIIGEAFYGSYGVITSIDNDKKIVHLDVDFFGRTTDVELEFSEVKKIQ